MAKFPTGFDPSRCVLFLGAGFSYDATNKESGSPPLASELSRRLKLLSGLSEADTSDLTDVAQYALSQGVDVYRLLQDLYSIVDLSESQKAILGLPWLRVYTTNYDNAVSFYRAKSGTNFSGQVYDFLDTPPRQLRQGSVVHLHGSLAKTKQEQVAESLILTRQSYVEQRVRKSAWWDWFDRDIKVAQYSFFVGYEMNDFEPAQYLIRHSTLKEKRHFILREPKSPVAASKIDIFGVRHSIGVDGFAKECQNAKVSITPKHENTLSSLSYIQATKDDKKPNTPSSAEIQELLIFGKVQMDGLRATLPESSYALFRSEIIEKCRSAIEESETLIVQSKIGNGKSIVIKELQLVLSQAGYNCFEVRENTVPLSEEIEFLKSMQNVVVFFPSYDSAYSTLFLFSELPKSTRYVIEIVTSTLQVRAQEVRGAVGASATRVNVDRLGRRDVKEFRGLLQDAGLTSLSRSAILQEGVEFRDFLIHSFKDPEVSRRLRSVIDPLLSEAQVRKLICASAMLKAAGQQSDPEFLRSATDEDPYLTLAGAGEGAFDLLELSVDKVEFHSSAIADHVLRSYFQPSELIGAVYAISAEAARRTAEALDFRSERFRRARSILSSTLRYSFVSSLLEGVPTRVSLIKKLYEACRKNSDIQREPLFWLQYSIYWQSNDRLDLAESHLEEAYERGKKIPDFRTFQLDTNCLGLLCEIEIRQAVGVPIQRFERIMDLVKTCTSMIDDGNHRNHVFRALEKIEPLVRSRLTDLGQAEGVTLTYGLHLIVEKLERFDEGDRALWGSDSLRDSIQAAIDLMQK